MQHLRTPMDSLSSLASSFYSAFSPLLPSSSPQQQKQGSMFVLLPLPVAAAARALTVLRQLLLLATHAFVSLFFMLLSALAPSPLTPPSMMEPGSRSPAAKGDTCVVRALAHVLSVASRLPVSSRKYDLVRGLAERLLDDNLRARAGDVNRAALAGAFTRTLRQLESPTTTVAAVTSMGEGFGGPAAEKLAAELLWLGKKMAECGAVGEAVAQFGGAERLGSRAVVAEPALQVSLLRLAANFASNRGRKNISEGGVRRLAKFGPVFLFKHANSKEFEQSTAGDEEDKGAVAEQRMAMLRSWLPLLCRGSTGTDAPVLTGQERAEMVAVLEELIDKLSWEQREEVLSLWLHHFASCPDTDWPNLESCYTRWYAESRRLLCVA
ncbi:hypothetical protein HU200_002121 [Digitaria exilis]|uniref:Uncharacterized protein n=1 Tax=Digitaria exilis TaxID=1010633 RepID=A0A835FX66_9POAL|nr:hypothetical protein HU200_002121 [Digitaria exilis]